MDYLINNNHSEISDGKSCHIDETGSSNIKETDKSTSDDLNSKELNILSDTIPDENVGQNVEAPGVESKCSISSTGIKDVSLRSSDEQIRQTNVGTSVSCPGPEITEARPPMRIRSGFRLPKFHLPRTTFRQFRRSSPKHGQLVEELSTPVNTLERNQEPITSAVCPDDRGRRRRLERLRKGMSFLSCSCMRQRGKSQDYRSSEDDCVRGLDSGRLELPSELTSVTNENAEVESRTDSG